MNLNRNSIRLTLAALIALAVIAILFLRRDPASQQSSPATEARSKSHSHPSTQPTDTSPEQSGKASHRSSTSPTLSANDATRASAIHDSVQQHLRDIELKRAQVFSQYQDADGNSTSTLLLERPTTQELDQMFGDFLKTLSEQDRNFIERSGLTAEVRKDIADFFDYDHPYRYITFLLAGDGSATLPTVLILESEKLYDRKLAADGKLDVPATELQLREFTDLKEGTPDLERYGRLFSLK